MQKQAQQIKRELDAMRVESGEVKGINIVINGSQDFQSIEVDESLLHADNKQRFEADLLRSVNAAIKKSQQVATEKMKTIMPGLPGV